MNQIEKDAQIIRTLGGPTKVAAVIGVEEKVSVQRVQNWLTRGIPPAIKVKYPHMFMPELVAAQSRQAANTVAQAI